MNLSLYVLKNLESDTLFSRLTMYLSDQNEENLSNLCYYIFENKAETNLFEYISNLVITDENAFSIASANQKPLSNQLKNAYFDDLSTIKNMMDSLNVCDYFDVGKPIFPFDFVLDFDSTINKLVEFYRSFGFGKFIYNKAFRFVDNCLLPITSPSDTLLSHLKDYEYEKSIIISNIENLLNGYPFADMLLYGERGTGKSSTVHALINEYHSQKLRIIEVSKENMLELASLKAHLACIPMKFLIFIDDLSLFSGDERISSLKASLEGCLEGYSNNAMVVATSNRRHIIDEKFSSRTDSVHANDSMQEELSLSDRFGINVLFSSTTKPQYLSIVFQLASDAGLTLSQDELESKAERWAIQKGGRSPRRARQFIDLAISCQKKNQPIKF